jgi:predicted nucleotidyltransferase
MELVRQNLENIQNLCKRYHVLRLYVFGSILTDKFNTKSDIDFLVDFTNVDLYDYADNFFDFKYSLQDLFQRDIDLIENKAITNPYFKNKVEKTKQQIYG